MKKCKNYACRNTIKKSSRAVYCSEICKKTKTLSNQPKCQSDGCTNLAPRGSDGRWRKFCCKECNSKNTLIIQAESRRKTWADQNKKKLILQKYQETSIDNYGVDHYMKLSQTKEYRKEKSLEKYGVEHHLQSCIIKEKKKQTCIDRYGKFGPPNPKLDLSIHLKLNDRDFLSNEHKTKSIKEIAQNLNVSTAWVYQQFKKLDIECNGYKFADYSGFESEVADYISYLNIKFEKNNRKLISPYEIDIYIPEYNIAIECNGSYWHSELNGKNKDYHLNKLKLCQEKNIDLIYIWEHEWKNRHDIIKSKLLSKFNKTDRIYARNCIISQIDAIQEKQFLEENHIQGYTSSSIRYGLYYNNVLVCIMTFGKSRFNKNYDYELIRYASLKNLTVVGGASRILKQFIKTINPKKIISYCDKSQNSGRMYRALGFIKESSSAPAYHYTKDYINFENRIKYQKHKLSKLLEIFDPALSEWDNMKNNGYDRIWDCGNDVYSLINNNNLV